MNRERILFLDVGSEYGGVETYLKNLAAMLSPYVEGYAVLSLPRLAAELREQGLQVVCLPILGCKWLKAVRLFLAAFVVPYMLVRFRIRTVQVNGFFESLLLGFLRLARRTTIFTMHNPFQTDIYSPWRNPERWVPRFLSKHSLHFASRVICVSEAVGAEARQILPEKNVTVIANWVEVPALSRQDFRRQPKTQLLFVGRLEAYKGVQLILAAMRQMPGVSLIVVGEGSYRPQLDRLAEGLDVRFTGFQSQPSNYFEEATVFVNPSLGPEGLPLTSLEAMAYGLPCLFSDISVHREIARSGLAAALFTSGDSYSLATRLTALLEDEAEQQSLGREARKAVEQRYSLRAATQQYMKAFGLTALPADDSQCTLPPIFSPTERRVAR